MGAEKVCALASSDGKETSLVICDSCQGEEQLSIVVVKIVLVPPLAQQPRSFPCAALPPPSGLLEMKHLAEHPP